MCSRPFFRLILVLGRGSPITQIYVNIYFDIYPPQKKIAIIIYKQKMEKTRSGTTFFVTNVKEKSPDHAVYTLSPMEVVVK